MVPASLAFTSVGHCGVFEKNYKTLKSSEFQNLHESVDPTHSEM